MMGWLNRPGTILQKHLHRVGIAVTLADMPLASREKKSLRQIAHHLDSVVAVGDQGLSEGVLAETERALTDHELIKVKLAIGDRALRAAAAEQLAEACAAEIVQSIGKVVVLYRANPDADPRLSNILRYS